MELIPDLVSNRVETREQKEARLVKQAEMREVIESRKAQKRNRAFVRRVDYEICGAPTGRISDVKAFCNNPLGKCPRHRANRQPGMMADYTDAPYCPSVAQNDGADDGGVGRTSGASDCGEGAREVKDGSKGNGVAPTQSQDPGVPESAAARIGEGTVATSGKEDDANSVRGAEAAINQPEETANSVRVAEATKTARTTGRESAAVSGVPAPLTMAQAEGIVPGALANTQLPPLQKRSPLGALGSSSKLPPLPSPLSAASPLATPRDSPKESTPSPGQRLSPIPPKYPPHAE